MGQYIHRKIQIMAQLGIHLTIDNINHMKLLHNEIQVDNYAKTLRKQHYKD